MDAAELKELLDPDTVMDFILASHQIISEWIEHLPDEAFKTHWEETENGKRKVGVKVDGAAERAFKFSVRRRFGRDTLRILGEESIDDEVDLEQDGETRPCLLVDMIDGTDLLQRTFSNWCSAVIVFLPRPKPEILGTFVAVPSTYLYPAYLYYATKYEKPAKKQLKETSFPLLNPVSEGTISFPTEQLRQPSQDRDLRNASICMYAQKSGGLRTLLSLNTNLRLVEWLNQIEELNDLLKANTERELGFRFYNLAGNPMMVRLADRIVDVVLELRGQFPHDVVAGAFIAVRAGAVLGKPTNHEIISLDELAVRLLQPGRRKVAYILAANDDLYREMVELLSLTTTSSDSVI